MTDVIPQYIELRNTCWKAGTNQSDSCFGIAKRCRLVKDPRMYKECNFTLT
jgi:carboxylesterase type B